MLSLLFMNLFLCAAQGMKHAKKRFAQGALSRIVFSNNYCNSNELNFSIVYFRDIFKT